MLERKGFDMKQWRSEAVESYRRYLSRPGISSEESAVIMKGIEELERIAL